MNIALWILQALLALAFLGGGGMKLATPIAEMAANGMNFVNHMPAAAVKLIGLAEVLGAVGLIVPAATRIQPKLTGIAAACLAVLMVGAVGTHVVLGEAGASGPSFVLGSLAAFVAWGRLKKEPIAPKAETP